MESKYKMTTHERMSRTFEHKETDRIPINDSPWAGTVRRWREEGMPNDADWRDYFDVDKTESISVDISPRFESRVIEKTDRYTILTTPWGVTLKNLNMEDSTPEFLDFTINTEEKGKKVFVLMAAMRRCNLRRAALCRPHFFRSHEKGAKKVRRGCAHLPDSHGGGTRYVLFSLVRKKYQKSTRRVCAPSRLPGTP